MADIQKPLTTEERFEQVSYWYNQVDSCSLSSVVDALFEEINEQMKEAEVPEEYYQEVFSLVNEDYTVRRN
tara:strand:+ start:1417 stop:1629 length:213 start_codon:yes stop_codon:yes gene_type:complete